VCHRMGIVIAMGVRAVFLVGFMGSGKNTVGQELARRLAWEFVDLDACIERRERQTIPDIFREKGEPAFRVAEASALRDLLSSLRRNSVVALGGGAFAHAENRELLRNWPSVFLDAPLDELWLRCSQDASQRPLGKDRKHFVELYWSRLPFYRESTVTVTTSGKELPSICSEIEGALRLGQWPESLGSRESTGESQ